MEEDKEIKLPVFWTVNIWRFWFEIGWFNGMPPCVFNLDIGLVMEAYPAGWLSIIIFGLQIAKASISIGLNHAK